MPGKLIEKWDGGSVAAIDWTGKAVLVVQAGDSGPAAGPPGCSNVNKAQLIPIRFEKLSLPWAKSSSFGLLMPLSMAIGLKYNMDPGVIRFLASAIHEFTQSLGKEIFYMIAELTGGRKNAFDTLAVTGLNAGLGILESTTELNNISTAIVKAMASTAWLTIDDPLHQEGELLTCIYFADSRKVGQ
jgi:hypothetical protein